MSTTLVASSNPFRQDTLSPSECYILDNGEDNNIFVWKGIRLSNSVKFSNLLLFCIFLIKYREQNNRFDHHLFSFDCCTTSRIAGPKANPGERKEAMTVAHKFIKEKNYSPRTKVV